MNKKNTKGFALVEFLVTIFIFSLIILLVGAFQADIFKFNRALQANLQSQSEVKRVIRPFANEVRSASQSNLGAFPIAVASSSVFVFYSDIDNDGLKEQIKYFLEGTDFKKGVIKPQGSPLTYNPADEKISYIIHDVLSNPTVFSYYDTNYDGTATSTPLEQPVSPSDVRLVKITLTVDSDPNKDPKPFTVTTQVSLRNLKDNL